MSKEQMSKEQMSKEQMPEEMSLFDAMYHCRAMRKLDTR